MKVIMLGTDNEVVKATLRKLGWSAGSTGEKFWGKRTVRRLEAAALVGAWVSKFERYCGELGQVVLARHLWAGRRRKR